MTTNVLVHTSFHAQLGQRQALRLPLQAFRQATSAPKLPIQPQDLQAGQPLRDCGHNPTVDKPSGCIVSSPRQLYGALCINIRDIASVSNETMLCHIQLRAEPQSVTLKKAFSLRIRGLQAAIQRYKLQSNLLFGGRRTLSGQRCCGRCWA